MCCESAAIWQVARAWVPSLEKTGLQAVVLCQLPVPLFTSLCALSRLKERSCPAGAHHGEGILGNRRACGRQRVPRCRGVHLRLVKTGRYYVS